MNPLDTQYHIIHIKYVYISSQPKYKRHKWKKYPRKIAEEKKNADSTSYQKNEVWEAKYLKHTKWSAMYRIATCLQSISWFSITNNLKPFNPR